jgi:hypothetical protein
VRCGRKHFVQLGADGDPALSRILRMSSGFRARKSRPIPSCQRNRDPRSS